MWFLRSSEAGLPRLLPLFLAAFRCFPLFLREYFFAAAKLDFRPAFMISYQDLATNPAVIGNSERTAEKQRGTAAVAAVRWKEQRAPSVQSIGHVKERDETIVPSRARCHDRGGI